MVVDKVSWFHDSWFHYIFQAPLPNIRRMIEGRVPKPPCHRGFSIFIPSSESSGLVFAIFRYWYMSKRRCPFVVWNRFIKCSLFRLLHVSSGTVSHRVLAFGRFEYEPPKSTRIVLWNAD